MKREGLIILVSICFVLVIAALPFMAGCAKPAAEVIKIVHIRPLTGSMAQMSQGKVRSFDWAFERIGYQVVGKK